jgi:hypothetical protein
LNVYWDRAARLRTAELHGGVLRGFSLGLALLVSLGLSGCMHKKVIVPVFPQTQVPLVTPPEPDNPQMVEAPEVEELPVPVAEAAANPRPRRRPAPKPPATTPPGAAQPQIAAVDSADEGSAIGELTTGGDAGPQMRQEAADLIASNEKRLKALTPQKVRAQRSQISKIQNFERQAQAALNSGDAEGAKTLATKAQLLLDDLDRGGAS